jgi:hypothetical protein
MPKENDWLAALRDECARTSQAAVARRINYSATVVNQVLKGAYKGDLHGVQRAVEGALLGMTVKCPVIGDLARNLCLDYQRQPFAATNPTRVQLARTCPKCTNNRKGGEA